MVNKIMIDNKEYYLVPEDIHKKEVYSQIYQEEEAKRIVRLLSYAELECSKKMVEMLNTNGELITSGEIATRTGFVASTVTFLVKKLEFAGIIDVRNLGRRGLAIKIKNKYFSKTLMDI